METQETTGQAQQQDYKDIRYFKLLTEREMLAVEECTRPTRLRYEDILILKLVERFEQEGR